MASKTNNHSKSQAENQTKKTSAAKKTSSGASAGGKKKNVKKAPQVQRTVPELREPERSNPEITQEAVIWLVLAFSVFAFISYFGIGGYIGSVISDVSFGLFGIMAYLLPLLVFLAAAFLISNKGNHIVGFKLASSAGLYLCLCSLMELMVNGYQPEIRIDKLYSDSAALKTGGGAVGGAVCSLFCPALGSVGAGIVIFILVIVCLVILTQKSLFAGMKHQGERVRRGAQVSKEKRAEKKEIRQQERMHREQLRQERRQQEEEERRILQERRQQEEEARRIRQEEILRADPQSGLPKDVQVVLPQYARMETQEWTRKPRAGRSKKSADGERETISAGSMQGAPEVRTSLEVPVIFPSTPRERRMDHRVTGMTMDTTIEELYEPSSAPEKKNRTRKKTGTRASVSAFPGNDSDTCYISLDRQESRKKPDRTESPADNQDEKTAEYPEVHIRGLSDDPETSEEPETVFSHQDDAGIEEMADEQFEDYPEETEDQEPELIEEPELLEESEELEVQETMDDLDAPGSQMAPEERKVSAGSSSWSDIWADETDLNRGGTSGTVFSEPVKKPAAENTQECPGDEGEEVKKESHGASPKKNPRSSQKEIQAGIASVEAEMAKTAEVVKREYVFPPLELLKKGKGRNNSSQEQEIRKTAAKLQQTLDSFGVRVTVTDVSCGPAVTRYELQPEQGVKVSRIVSLADDIKLNLAAADIRIEAPIPGKAAVGIEVPNAENSAVMLRDLLESEEFRKHSSKLAFATGKDIAGKVVVSDIARMPHLLIAGATGSGKSVCINTLIMSILYKASPEDVKLIMIDPKVVELSVYNGIPHLYIPVVTDPKKAAGALNWGVAEMTDRYNKFAEMGVRNLKGYNEKVESLADIEDENKPKKLPQIVIIVDELADLMMVAPGEVEDSICRLAQLARAAGIHLIIATQRPSVNVITGLIKANMPSRIAFSVSSSVDSRTIIDMGGAEKLLGKGDMLFYPQGYQKPARVQGAFVSDEEVADVVDFLKDQNMAEAYDSEMEEQIAKVEQAVSSARGSDDVDALFHEAGKFIIEKDKASIGMLQRVFKIGFNRAARIMDQLSEAGVVGPEEGTKPRKILMTLDEFEQL